MFHTMRLRHPLRSRLLCSMAAALSFQLAPAVAADTSHWPDRPLIFILPSAPGGSPDVTSRLITSQVAKQLNTPVIVENRPGAAGNIGMASIKRAQPTGYTIGYGNVNTLAVNQ